MSGGVAQECGKDPSLIARWSSANSWVRRVAAHQRHLDELRRRERDDALGRRQVAAIPVDRPDRSLLEHEAGAFGDESDKTAHLHPLASKRGLRDNEDDSPVVAHDAVDLLEDLPQVVDVATEGSSSAARELVACRLRP